MATTIIKSATSDNQALVDSTGHLYVTTGGGSGGSLDTNLTEVGGAPITEGQKTMANSLPVVIASDQSPINVVTSGSSVVSGTVNTNVLGLNVFQTSQYSVGLSAVQLTPAPLTNRSSMSVKATCTSSNAVYLGNSNAVTTSTGYPLFNGDVTNIDLTGSSQLWAIASAASQTVYVLELAD